MSYYQKQMVDVSRLGLRCPQCGIEIMRLPFKPRRGMTVYCPDCAKKRRHTEPSSSWEGRKV